MYVLSYLFDLWLLLRKRDSTKNEIFIIGHGDDSKTQWYHLHLQYWQFYFFNPVSFSKVFACFLKLLWQSLWNNAGSRGIGCTTVRNAARARLMIKSDARYFLRLFLKVFLLSKGFCSSVLAPLLQIYIYFILKFNRQSN